LSAENLPKKIKLAEIAAKMLSRISAGKKLVFVHENYKLAFE